MQQSGDALTRRDSTGNGVDACPSDVGRVISFERGRLGLRGVFGFTR
jgi:hypothetical protein